MTQDKKPDWKARAAALNPPIPEDLLDRIEPSITALDEAFQRVREQIVMDELMWDGPHSSVTPE